MDDRYLDHCYEVAGRRIDPVVGEVSQRGERSKLSRKQLEVLAMLVSAPGEMVPRQAFIQKVWEGNAPVGERGLTDTVYALRRSLGDSSVKNPLIRTIPRRGYQLHGDVRLLEHREGLSFSASLPVPGRPDWRLLRLLSKNDVTETWLAEQTLSGARRAFRFCRNEAHLQRLRREVTVLRYLREKLATQSDVLSIIDWQLDEPPYFLEMHSAAHGSLADWAEIRGGVDQIPLAERIHLVEQAASALAAVHSAGVVHRNVSPTSIFIDEDEGEPVAKLGEFGLGDLTDRSELSAMGISAAGWTLTADGRGRGSFYLPPERETGEAAGDVYALGVVLYQLVIGDLQREATDPGIGAIGSAALRELVAACVDPVPRRRPTAQSLCQRLGSLDLNQEEIAAAEPKPSPSTGQRSRAGLGESIGPFRLLDVLGEGGMGTVYLAEQRDPVERKVALKLIRAGMDSDQVLARFEAERQALALMDHPNVAAVYDAGRSASGHPYFAMEYVPGFEITAHCDRSKLGVHERVELFLQVCDGVQHAHQKGLIHRDLKPSNLLVKDPPGQPATVKIIDFGVAKSLQRKLTDHTVHTRLGTFVGTPSYSSPEQISGHLVDVDTRADVYSLGIVLYELLTGVTPYSPAELAGKSPLELVKLLSSNDPPTPLARFTRLTREDGETIASNRSQSVEDLKQLLAADVAWIIHKCLERDPEDRYPSVLELKKDLLRWLEDRPVEARPATRIYRLRKLVRRHRTAFLLATLATMTLVTTTSVAIVGFLRAQESAARATMAALEAEKAADFQVRQLQALDPSAMGAGFRQSLIEAADRRSDQSGGVADDDDQHQLDRLLQGVNFTDLTLEQLDKYFLEPALEEIETSYRDFPVLQTRLWQAMAEVLVNWGDFERAAKPQDLALEGRRAQLGADDPLTLASLYARGVLRMRLGKLDEAEADLEAAVAGFRKVLGPRDSATVDALADLGFAFLEKGEFAKAEPCFREVLEILGDDHPDTANALNRMGTLLQRQGRLEEAEVIFRKALDRHLRDLGPDNLNTVASFNHMAQVLRAEERLEEAEDYYRKAVDGARRMLGDEHPATLTYMSNLAELLGKAGRIDEAEPLYRATLATERRVLGDQHPKTLHLMNHFAGFLRSSGQLDEAERLYREALSARRRILGDGHPETLTTIYRLSALLKERGALEEAEKLAQEALEGLRRVFGDDHLSTLRSLRYLGDVLRAQGKSDLAEQCYREALAGMQRTLGDSAAPTVETQELLAGLLREKGQLEEAAELEQAVRRAREAMAKG